MEFQEFLWAFHLFNLDYFIDHNAKKKKNNTCGFAIKALAGSGSGECCSRIKL